MKAVAANAESKGSPGRPNPGPGHATRVIVAVNRASNTLGIGTCLVRALAIVKLLRLADMDAHLCIGTEQSGGIFRAHAWVEGPGVPLMAGNHDSGYQSFLLYG